MADYVEADFSHLYLGGEATGYGTLYRDNNVRVQLGGGGGFGLVIFTGKLLRQTPLGRADDGRPSSADGSTCESLDDFADFERCQPQWWDDPEVDQDGDGDRDNDVLDDSKLEDQDGFADCSANRCDPDDLERFGTRDKTFSTPILALPKLYLSARVLIKETFGINLRGGFNGGLYMGANFQYFFGSK